MPHSQRTQALGYFSTLFSRCGSSPSSWNCHQGKHKSMTSLLVSEQEWRWRPGRVPCDHSASISRIKSLELLLLTWNPIQPAKIGFCSMSSRVMCQQYKPPTESYIKDNSRACETFGNNLHTVKKLLEQFMIISITWWDSLASQLLWIYLQSGRPGSCLDWEDPLGKASNFSYYLVYLEKR